MSAFQEAGIWVGDNLTAAFRPWVATRITGRPHEVIKHDPRGWNIEEGDTWFNMDKKLLKINRTTGGIQFISRK